MEQQINSTEESQTGAKRFEGNYFQWLRSELSGWDATPWSMFWFGVSFQLCLFLTNPINLTTTITFIATVFGLLCVVAMMVGKSVNGLLGFISAIGFIYVNFTAGHFASVLDQTVFMLCIDLPLMIKWRTWGEDFDAKLRHLNVRGWIIVLAIIAVAWFSLFHAYTALHDTNPLWDSLVLSIGATASVMIVFHFNDTYTLWLAEDVVNVLLWFTALKGGYSQSSLPMLVVTLTYTVTAIYGKFYSPWSAKHYKEVQSAQND
ncbi:nicotinamide riboside transporter PnuC [Lacticaseibacillus pabuli]|uniref:Nicotinamide riboside transporter PnuC n=1 Tax=Lacticaseibacillus pabuli TaxID=3025672 RepID=A0ABY7WV60_9LACO|nr:nicotinamide riboside transporter PnuC [Lacticaseibacillus sp. KACC 23028]WDF82867.1 nicotinamide riboside transporter PnuC [Lacticaseibacillus sp. KACC 23028]